MSDARNGHNFSCEIKESEEQSGDVKSVAWNPVERGLLASCGDDGDVKLWQLPSVQ